MHPAQADRRRAQVGVAALAVLLAAADSYVVVLALPDIMTGVGIDVDQLQRATPIVTGFLLGYIVGLPPLGRLSDLYGRVPVLLASLGVFCVGCVITAGSHDLGAVVVGRALQGVGGGGLVPATLALVADRWPEDRRGTPLGAVGAAQEFGSVLGPLYGGAVLAVSGWRTIFWANLGGGLVLAGALVGITRGARAARRPPGAVVTAVLAALALAGLVLVVTAPATLTGQLTIGAAYVPVVAGAAWSSPLVLLTAALATGVAGLLWRRGTLRRLSTEADLIGAGLLGLALAGLVLAFATADPSRQALADRAPALLGGAALCAGLFAWRQRRARHPLVPGDAVRPTAGWGALAVNLFVGAALIAALVDVPLFARATRYPDSQLGAALVLVELLAALPVGALLGGLLCRRLAPRSVATVGLGLTALGFLGMSRWGERALDGPARRHRPCAYRPGLRAGDRSGQCRLAGSHPLGRAWHRLRARRGRPDGGHARRPLRPHRCRPTRLLCPAGQDRQPTGAVPGRSGALPGIHDGDPRCRAQRAPRDLCRCRDLCGDRRCARRRAVAAGWPP